MKLSKRALAFITILAVYLSACSGDNQSSVAAGPEAKTTFDIVIANGRVIDPETDLDAIRNVGIKDGVIAAISTEVLSGERLIDASEHIVSPGFVDTHNHGAVTPARRQIEFARRRYYRYGFGSGLHEYCRLVR